MPDPVKVIKATAGVLLAGFVALNILALHHARAMMVYSTGGARTQSPEDLSGFGRLRVLLAGVNLPRPEDNRPPSALAPDAQALRIDVPGGITLSAWQAGHGEPAPLVIFFHGYSTDKTRLLREARQILAMGCSVLLVDFRGSGGSSEAHVTLGVEEADDVLAAVRHARRHLPHSALVLYGQSMGAAAILRAVRVHGLDPDAVILESVFDTMLGTVRNRFAAMGLPSFPAAELLTFWGGRRFGFNGFAHRPVEDAAALACPALFLHGADDPRATAAEGRRVHDAVGGPRQFVVFEQVGHASPAARHPEPWHAAVSGFLSPFLRPD